MVSSLMVENRDRNNEVIIFLGKYGFNVSLSIDSREELCLVKKPYYDPSHNSSSKAKARVPKELRSKLDPKTHQCIFVGYGVAGEMGYCL